MSQIADNKKGGGSVKLSVTLGPDFDFFLADAQKGRETDHYLTRKASVKDIIESLGIPHTEVGRIDFNGREIDFSDETIADLAQAESRIVLTRDTALLKRKKIVFGRRIRADLPYDHVLEAIDFFGLHDQTAFFSLCTGCRKIFWKGSHYDAMKPRFSTLELL